MTVRKFFFVLLLLAILLGNFPGPGPCLAQSYRSFQSELDHIVKTARWRLGPFRIYPSLSFRLFGYDNNVFYERGEENPVSDFNLTISPGVTFYLLFRNFLILSLDESPEYVHYFKQIRERRANNTLTPSFKMLLFNRFVISGSYSKRSQRWRVSSEFNARANEFVEDYYGSMFFETARETSFGISVFSTKLSYEDRLYSEENINLSQALNRKERRASFEFYYRIFSESFAFVSLGYLEYDFESSQAFSKDSHAYQAYSGVRFPLLERMNGTLSLGFKKFIPEAAEMRPFSGLIGETSIGYRSGRFRFLLGFDRDIPFSINRENLYYIDNTFTGGISYYLLSFLRLDYTHSAGKANYPEKISFLQPDGSYLEIQRKDSYQVQSAGFVIRIIRDTGIGIRLNRWKRDSNYFGESRERISIETTLEYSF